MWRQYNFEIGWISGRNDNTTYELPIYADSDVNAWIQAGHRASQFSPPVSRLVLRGRVEVQPPAPVAGGEVD